MITAIGSSNFWDRFWDLGKTLLYVALLVGGLFVVVRTFKRTSEEFVPTGLTVGELMAGGLTQGEITHHHFTSKGGIEPVSSRSLDPNISGQPRA